jgi:two-component system response regulator
MELRTILYAEDNPLDADLTMEALKENNMANPIILVGDGVEALEYLSCEGIYTGRKPVNPGLILLDLKMPRMDGLEFLSIVKKDIRFKRIPVVMLTSSREETDLIKSYNLSLNAYIVKPLDFISLIEVVKQIGNFWAIINELPSE